MSIFSKIIAGELPCYKIFEDELCLVILDIRPVTAGHLLVIPKIEVDHFQDLEEPYYSRIFQVAKELSPKLLAWSKSQRIGMLISGYGIPHVHIHLIPTNDGSGTELSRCTSMTPEELTKIQQSIIESFQ